MSRVDIRSYSCFIHMKSPKIHSKKNTSPVRHDSFMAKIKKYTVLLIIVGMGLIGTGVYILVSSQFKNAVETPQTDRRHMPKGVNIPPVATSSATYRVPILLYHYVEHIKDKKDTTRQSLNINPNTFDLQIKTLTDAGYTFMTASELADVIDNKIPLPPKPILITIDDGHWDLTTDILPILKKYNVKATAYIISGFIGGSDFLSQPQLTDVIQSGLVEIGAHTVHHIGLAGKLSSVVQYEVTQSKTQLENTYHLKVVSFAYPGGSFDQTAIAAVKKAGFRTAISTVPGVMQSDVNRFYLYRIRPGYRTGQALLTYLQRAAFKPW